MKAMRAFYLSCLRTSAVTVAEVRSAIRLIRTWLFLIVAALLMVSAFIFYTHLHGRASGTLPFAGFAAPEYILGSLGTSMLWIFLIGSIFLAFDVRARDVRERIHEAIDSRPVSNLELLFGRLIGITLVLWVATACVVGLLTVIGAGLESFTWWMGGVPKLLTSFTFLVVDCLPIFLFFGAIMIFLAVLLKLRLAVAMVALSLIAVHIAVGYISPAYLLPVTGIVTAFIYLPSEVSPRIAELPLLLQRASMLLFAGGLVAWAAALFPRRDVTSRMNRTVLGAVLMAAGSGLITYVVLQAITTQAQIKHWKNIHTELQQERFADLERIDGRISIEPGRRLKLALGLTVRPQSGDSVIFTLNPGLKISEIQVDGTNVPYTFENGALQIPISKAWEGTSTTLELRASGKPDRHFAYLDSPLDPSEQQHSSSSLILLGQEPLIFRRDFVALMPGTHWLPTSGSGMRGMSPEIGRDYFQVNLSVDVPAGWHIAGPGLAEVVAQDADVITYRFRPSAPLPMVGMIAGKYHRVSTVIEDVEFALLLDPDHLDNLEYFSDSADQVEKKLGRMVSLSKRFGLKYPYGGITMAEVPNSLRIHGGGWDAPSVQALPGLLLLREHSFPTARFDQLRDPGIQRFPHGTDDWKLGYLWEFLSKDSMGGNPFVGLYKNHLSFLTSARGAGSPAINHVIYLLSIFVLHGSSRLSHPNYYPSLPGGYFSAHAYLSNVVTGQEMMSQMWETLGKGQRSMQLFEDIHEKAIITPSAWSLATETALIELDYANSPEMSIEAVALKGRRISQALFAYFGHGKIIALLAALRNRYSGTTYTYDDLTRVAAELGMDLEGVLTDWLTNNTLPGFTVSPATGVRLPDTADDVTRYQTSFHVFNDEPASGIIDSMYWLAHDSHLRFTQPVSIKGHESLHISFLSEAPLERILLRPYLSLNRIPIEVVAPASYSDSDLDQEPAPAVQESDWQPNPVEGMVVDDLDAEFHVASIESQTKLGVVRLLRRLVETPPQMDGGLPMYERPKPTPAWARSDISYAWGKYRRTIAVRGPGKPQGHVEFKTELPSAGLWRLQNFAPKSARYTPENARWFTKYYPITPWGSDPIIQVGEFALRIESGTTFETVMFNYKQAEPGWNTVGDFELQEGDVTVAVITGWESAVADAIRWLPIEQTANE